MLELRQCELCYDTSLDVQVGIAWYRTAEPGQQVQSIARCKDVAACRQRVAKSGERWPLRERDEDAA